MEALQLILGIPFACFWLYLIFRPNNNIRWFKEKELQDYNEQFDRENRKH
jgi:predicted nuclease of predicted toxin-antitoxin system